MSERVLNSDRTAELWAAVKARSLPMKAVTRAEYESLAEEQRQAEVLYLVESGIADVQGLSGLVPTGAVVPFLGLRAPAGYLICNGAEYSVSQYLRLAQYFVEQFGTANHFGGDGTATFSVPDMRNLFLRGYHGEAEEQLSGEIGAKQDGTNIPYMFTGVSQVSVTPDISITPSSEDYVSDSTARRVTNVDRIDSGSTVPKFFKARPINMAVLYCIKT